MAFEGSPNRSTGSPTPPSAASDRPSKERHPAPTQWLKHLVETHVVLARSTRADSVAVLNQILADTMTLRDFYKKHHEQTSGAPFHQLHLLFDKHYEEQAGLTEAIAERIQSLGGIRIARAADVAETTMLGRPPPDGEAPSLHLAWMFDAHERVLYGVWAVAWRAALLGDDGTHDLLVSEVTRMNEQQAWSIQEQLLRRRRVAHGS